jgi:ribonuclease HI
MTSISNPVPEATWILWVDGASNVNGGGAGIILEGPDELTVEQFLKFKFKASNNQAEFEALIVGLRVALDLGVYKEMAKGVSRLLSNHVSGTYKVKDKLLAKYMQVTQQLLSRLTNFKLSMWLGSKMDELTYWPNFLALKKP